MDQYCVIYNQVNKNVLVLDSHALMRLSLHVWGVGRKDSPL